MTDDYTTATALVVAAIGAYKAAHGIPSWEDDMIEIAEPGSELWDQWTTGYVLGDSYVLPPHMEGDPATAEVALCVDGSGQFYGCVEAAIADLPRYFSVGDDEEDEAP